jgi:hypothetical protein
LGTAVSIQGLRESNPGNPVQKLRLNLNFWAQQRGKSRNLIVDQNIVGAGGSSVTSVIVKVIIEPLLDTNDSGIIRLFDLRPGIRMNGHTRTSSENGIRANQALWELRRLRRELPSLLEEDSSVREEVIRELRLLNRDCESPWHTIQRVLNFGVSDGLPLMMMIAS